jgi:hypothetical protein
MSEESVHALVATTLLVVFGALAVVLTLRLMYAIRKDDPIGISSHWGGLGGGTGGWRLSPALVSLLGALAASLLCAAVGVYYVEGTRERERQRLQRDDALALIEREERRRTETRNDERERIEREERHRQEDRADRAESMDKANKASKTSSSDKADKANPSGDGDARLASTPRAPGATIRSEKLPLTAPQAGRAAAAR